MQRRCALCEEPGGETIWADHRHRVVLPPEPDYPGFVRVIWNAHVAEMTDLSTSERRALLDTVLTAEGVVREALEPDKINLASLGNVVPHLHWHVIPRWSDDLHFPAPVWAAPQPAREAVARQRREQVGARLEALRAALRAALGPAGRDAGTPV